MNLPISSAPQDLAERLSSAGRSLLSTAADLDRDSLAAPSALPDWSRAHVVAHVEGVARALQRQIEYAARGERIEFYDGGYEGRVRDIELRAQRPAEEQLSNLVQAVDQVVESFAGLAPDGWEGRISYRDGTVRDGGLALWRELTIHATDLDAGHTPLDWDPDFCDHLIGFLTARVPDGTALELQPLGEQPRTLTTGTGDAGAGDPGAADAGQSDPGQNDTVRTVVVAGRLQDMAAWMAGRTPVGSLDATAAGDAVDLPELLPWPAAVAPRA
ncbi:maleylpyruvate isomerase family mycothiol-dependent enzyme [Arthrobacter sp. JZ12]|uniref:maleylpyruvate isomerase family mycothiol-dependent enzyme n=1 Tax=Arthrobacter sp. JZ12 TaxID=2654190 RepID=UPI002B48099E|nr:maleylpyruvate isomerase family mycothiol-dependent enzyme [Arthrobacter sp. JZ12]